jgi:peptidoglycan/xylan/chitin deacetylase (PgdA/CDA1 family)
LTSIAKRAGRLAARTGLLDALPRFGRGSLVVLMYHYFCPDDAAPDELTVRSSDLRKQLEYVLRRFRVRKLAEALGETFDGETPEGPTICVTVDDVGTDFERHAWPSIEALSVPVTVAICPALLGEPREETLFGIAHALLRHSPESTFRLRRDLGMADLSYECAWDRLRSTDPARLRTCLVDLGFLPDPGGRVPGYVRFPLLGTEALRGMAATGLLDVASHSMTHPDLSRLRGDWLRYELAESKRRIESDFGACPIFVYPGGQRTVPPEPGTEAAREAGYAFAFAGPPDSVGPEKDAMALGRVGVLGTEDFDMFRLRVGFASRR